MSRKLEYSHLVEPLLVQDPPAGLYKEPRIWMEGRDLEGFKAHFSYGFIKNDGPMHLTEGMIVHPCDECLFFAGLDETNTSSISRPSPSVRRDFLTCRLSRGGSTSLTASW